ncbi:MAG TPA: DUF1573 domain-containing protein [Sedimentisphaerales bacterium]|nr:DUF1573 domain-containing protein [Sedimentisphaerales bacterium]
MKRGCLMLTAVAAFLLFVQVGCKEQTRVSKEPAVRPVEPTSASPPRLSSSQAAEPKETIVSTPPKVITPPPPVKTPAEPEPNAPEQSALESGAPKITFENVTHDFGNISPGSKNTCEFKFRNTGDALLRIGKIQTTCGCTVAELAKKEYAPGESGAIKAAYTAGRSAGATTKHLTVPSNDKENSKVRLTIRATAVMKVSHEPSQIKLRLRGDAAPPEIRLRSLDNQAFAVKGFSSPGEGITASFDPSMEAMEFVLQPKVDVEKLKKHSRGQIKIDLTHPQCNSVTIPFSVVPEFQITPNVVTLRNVEPQKPVKREVYVINNYDDDFEIASVSSQKDAVRVLSQEKLGTRYKLVLEITPPPAGDNKGFFRDVFSVKIGNGQSLSVTCQVFYSTGTAKP